MKFGIFLVLLLTATAKFIRDNHDYWFTAGRKSAETGIAYADVAWNYCDYKCLYLESLYPNNDFYIVNFKDAFYKPNFSACYVKPNGGTTQLWNRIANNKFYETYCGNDIEDYLDNANYEKISEEGVGIGTLIHY